MGNSRKMELKFLIIPLSLVLFIQAQENTVCILPGTSQASTCVRLHLCDSFQTIIRNAKGRPTPDQIAEITRHQTSQCGSNTGLVCCPPFSSGVPSVVPTSIATQKPAPTQSPVAFSMKPNNVDIPTRSNLDVLKMSKNFGLINEKKCGLSPVTDRIIGGTEAQLGEFPWMALLRYKSRLGDSFSFNCGGTLITPWYVLTAGHCITRDLVSVRLGEHTISTEQDCTNDPENRICSDPVQDIDIDKVIRHASYNNVKKINDIALLRLKSAANVAGRYVRTICLPTSSDNQIEMIEQIARDKMTITGWGKIENGNQSDVLRKAYIPYVKHDVCVKRFAPDIPVYESYLCAGGKNKTDTCNGDSGGPIQSFGTVNGKTRNILFGVVSVGIQCLNPDVIYPGIYTNVAYYLDWILANIY